MKILFINRVLGMFRGGGETYALNIAKHLSKLGCDIEFITSKPYFGNIKYPIDGFHAEYVPSPCLRDVAQQIMSGVSYIKNTNLFFLKYFEKIYEYSAWKIYNFDDEKSQNDIFRYLRKQKKNYDVIQIFGHVSLAGRIAKELKLPVVLRFPGPMHITSRRKESMLQCDALVANGDAFLYYKKEAIENIINIPPGIDTGKFRPVDSDIRRKYGISPNDKLILFVGRFVPLKNLPFMIKGVSEVMKSDNEVKLMLVGEGPLYAQITGIVSQLGIKKNVIFAGSVTHAALPEYYSASDLFLLTSNYDNFPNVVIEAMACGLPVIGTRVGGVPQLLEEGIRGFCIENNNISELKDTVLKVINDKRLCREIGERNIKFARENYSWERSAQRFLKVYQDILGKR